MEKRHAALEVHPHFIHSQYIYSVWGNRNLPDDGGVLRPSPEDARDGRAANHINHDG